MTAFTPNPTSEQLHIFTDPHGAQFSHPGTKETCTAPSCQPLVPIVNYEPGSKLEQLHGEYWAAKAEKESAETRLKAAVDALKVELTVAAPDQPKVELHGAAGRPLHLVYVESWRVDAKKLKAEQPVVYVKYATKSGTWKLEAKRGGGS